MSKLSRNDKDLLDCLPQSARDFIIGINKATHSPVALILTCLLTTNSASLGGGSLASLDSWEVCPNLYGMAVAPSGVGKSAGVKPIIEPLEGIQNLYRKSWEEWRIKKLSELEIVMIQLNQIKNQIRKTTQGIDEEIRLEHARLTAEKESLEEATALISKPLLTVNDFTEEALSVYASKQPFHSLYLVTPEGRNVMKIINGRYGGNGSTSETFLVMAYSGDPLAVTRLSREELRIKAHLSLFIAVQEDVFEDCLRTPTFTQSGFFPRCLITRHTERIKVQPQRVSINQEYISWWQNHLQQNYDYFREEETPKQFTFSSDASKMLRAEEEFQLNAIQAMSSVHDSYVARHLENLIKVSVNLHSLHLGIEAIDKPITSQVVSKAITLMRFYRSEQLSILHESAQKADEALKTRLIDILAENENASVSISNLKGRNTISPEECERMVEKYPDTFIIEKTKPGKKGGRPKFEMKLLR